jgi:hypothetical protein
MMSAEATNEGGNYGPGSWMYWQKQRQLLAAQAANEGGNYGELFYDTVLGGLLSPSCSMVLPFVSRGQPRKVTVRQTQVAAKPCSNVVPCAMHSSSGYLTIPYGAFCCCMQAPTAGATGPLRRQHASCRVRRLQTRVATMVLTAGATGPLRRQHASCRVHRLQTRVATMVLTAGCTGRSRGSCWLLRLQMREATTVSVPPNSRACQ